MNRHARKHYPATQPTCEDCGKTFDRSDTLRRHRQLHLRDGQERMPRAARACDCCHASKTRCDGKKPCNVCSRRGLRCTFSRSPKQALVGNAATSKVMSEPEVQTSRTSVDYQEHERSERSERPLTPGASKEVQTLILQHENYLRDTTLLTRTERNGEGDQGQLDIEYHVEIYFAHFHSQWPIIHKPSFLLSKDSQPHVLILSLAMIGLWVTGEMAARTRAKNMHEKLVTLLESRMGDWKSQKDFKDTSWPMTTFQAVLLNVIFAPIREAPPDLQNRCSSMVRAVTTTCIAGGLFCYDRIRAQLTPDESLLFSWTWVEETKRLALALFKANLLYNTWMLSISDLWIPLPDGGYLWDALGSREFYRRYHAQVGSGTHETPLICNIFRDVQRGGQGLGLLLQTDGWLGFLASEQERSGGG